VLDQGDAGMTALAEVIAICSPAYCAPPDHKTARLCPPARCLPADCVFDQTPQ